MATPDAPDNPEKRRRPTARRVWTILATIAVGLVVLALVVPLLWPVPSLPGAREPIDLADADSRFAVIGGQRIHYKTWGSPDSTCTVLLLHGFGASVFSWRDVGPELAERGCFVVAPDRTGFGLTERPLPPRWGWKRPSPYSRAAQSDQAAALLAELGVERAVVVGHSQGAGTAALLAARHPELVSALVLSAPAVSRSSALRSLTRPLLASPQARRIGPLLVRGIAGPGSDAIIRQAFADPSAATDYVIAGYRRPLSARDWDRGLWEQTIALEPQEPEDALAGLAGKVPVLVVVPTADRIVDPARQREAAALARAQTEVVAGGGHVYHEERPGAFAALVERFIAERVGPAEATAKP